MRLLTLLLVMLLSTFTTAHADPTNVGAGGEDAKRTYEAIKRHFSPDTPPRKFVFLCDASESMRSRMPVLKDELFKAIVGLRPIQSVDIIVYQGDTAVSFDTSMQPATPAVKRSAGAWVNDLVAKGEVNPIPAMEMSLKLEPDQIFFVAGSAGIFDGKALTDAIDKNNKNPRLKINTILLGNDSADQAKHQPSERLMQQIAADHHGTYQWVTEETIRAAERSDQPPAPASSPPATQPASSPPSAH